MKFLKKYFQASRPLPAIDWLINPANCYFDVPAQNLAEFDAYQEAVFRCRFTSNPPVFRVPPAIASLLKNRQFIFGAYRIEAKDFSR